MAHDVFVSYASEDKTVADAVCASLESHAVPCWMAPRDVLPGVAYGESIMDAIHGCRIMVLVFSSKSNVSPHVAKEVERAVSAGVPVIPFRIEDVAPGRALDYFIGNVHWLDALMPPLEQHLERLAQNVQTLLSRDVPAIERKTAREVATGVSPVAPGTAASALNRGATQSSAGLARKRYIVLAACITLLAAAFVAYYLWPRSNTPSGPAKITQISQWNKPINQARLSPDSHSVAFVSPVGGVSQVFLMLTSGGEPLQLTNDEGNKVGDSFSADGKEIYYGRSLGRDEVWAVPTLGGAPRRVVSGYHVVPSPDGAFIYYVKNDNAGIFRAGKSGLNEELVYKSESTGLYFFPLLLFPDDNDLLAVGVRMGSPNRRFHRINLTSHDAVDLGEISGNPDAVWAEPGKTLLFSRTVNGLTNIWNYGLQDRSLTQITFGTGPDFSPMPDPGGKGIYYVNGKSSGFLTAYHVHSKESTDIASEDAAGPEISPDGKRVMYVTLPAPQRKELWVSDIDGGDKVKIAAAESLGTGNWAPDNFHLSFNEAGAGEGSKVYIVGADGSGLRQLPLMEGRPNTSVWSADQKSVYGSATEKAGSVPIVWKWSVDGSNPEKFVDNCGYVFDADPGGQYLIGVVQYGEKTGIYEVSISDRKCIPLLPGVVTFSVIFARDGKSFLYAVASRGDVTIYRQPWRDGKTVGASQVALKVPFAFPLGYNGGNAYDFSRDLSTIVYARPSGHADLYLLSQK